jgi:hypothetical protein
MSDLQAIRTIIARLNSGKNANEDSWMTYVSLIRCMALTLSIFFSFLSECGMEQTGETFSSPLR